MANILYIFSALVIGIFLAVLLNAVQMRKNLSRVPLAPSTTFSDRAKHLFITGTDNDLKIELGFLIYLAATIFTTNSPFSEPRHPLQLLPTLLAIILGFYFRQWLSKWRLLNLVSLSRLLSDKTFVWKPGSTLAFAITNLLIIYVVYMNPFYAAFVTLGVFAHEMSLETRKNRFVLRRRLHLFDLDLFLDDSRAAEIIHKVVKPGGLRSLDRLVSSEKSPQKRLILETFKELLTNNQNRFQEILAANMDFIKKSPDLCYYFGRALYSVGDLVVAEDLLSRGCSEKPDVRCAAYLALIALAPGKHPEGAKRAISILQPYLKEASDSAGDMLAHTYYALASIMLSEQQAKLSEPEARDALVHIHNANRINEQFLAQKKLGSLSYSYYRGNEIILMDICGYIVSGLGEPRLGYRILEGAIQADNTYPWPYFHIALIYKRFGKRELARSLFARIALNERSPSVIYNLSVAQMKELNV